MEKPKLERRIVPTELTESDFKIYKTRIDEHFNLAGETKNPEEKRIKLEAVLSYSRQGLEKTDNFEQVKYLTEALIKAQDQLTKMSYQDGKRAITILKEDMNESIEKLMTVAALAQNKELPAQIIARAKRAESALSSIKDGIKQSDKLEQSNQQYFAAMFPQGVEKSNARLMFEKLLSIAQSKK